MKQKTLKSSFSLQGKGLHTGLLSTVSFLPAPENHGYKIQRVDLENRPVIKAVAENVVDTRRGTVLGKDGVRCGTIEHAMAALYALGIDNVLIQVNAPEFPILDGSALPYIKEILRVGMAEQNAEKDCLAIGEEITYVDRENGASICLLEEEGFSVGCTIEFEGKEFAAQCAELNGLEGFVSEIAPARTFVFVDEIERLLDCGLIKGGGLDNAIVIYAKQTSQESLDRLCRLTGVERHDATKLGYLQHKGLLWDNEPARHKVLDVLGDLALIGRPLKGHVSAYRPGHTTNIRFARTIRERYVKAKAPLFEEVIEFKDDRIQVVKNLNTDSTSWRDNRAGIKMVEAMAWAGEKLMERYKKNKERETCLVKISNIELKQSFSPMGYLVFEVCASKPLGSSGYGAVEKFHGSVTQKGVCIAEASFSAQIRNK